MKTEIDVCEFDVREGAKFALDGLQQARARAHALLLVLSHPILRFISAQLPCFSLSNRSLCFLVSWTVCMLSTEQREGNK